MTRRAELIVCGEVVVIARPGGVEIAEAVGIADGRVVTVGTRDEVRGDAAPGATMIDARDRAVIPGLHDFHVHLVGLARARRSVALDDARDAAEVADRLRAAAGAGGWVTGRGWTESQLAGASLDLLEEAVGERPTFLMSHDHHSAWASRVARGLAGLDAATPDPAGGRIERDAHGEPTGVLRETALDLVAAVVARLQGEALRAPLTETLDEVASFGITGATEAGDYTDANGVGADAALGDSYSSLTDLADVVDGRLRLTLDIPVDAIAAAHARGLRTGAPLPGRRTLRFGWAKEYADGALGSGTAALFAPRTCGERDTGLLRVDPAGFDRLVSDARAAGIGLAVHAIGDRAGAAVLDALERGRPRAANAPADRMEHVQLLRAEDRGRFARLGLTASVQPVHVASDRDLVDACWDGRQADAYAFRSLAAAGALLAGGSDAPVESANPWLGIFAAVHRRFPSDERGGWWPSEALSVPAALSMYTLGSAAGIGARDEGHLRPGARADLAVLSIDLPALLRGGDEVAGITSELTLLGGNEVHRSPIGRGSP